MTSRPQPELLRIIAALLVAIGFAASWHVFLKMHLARSDGPQKARKANSPVSALEHKYALDQVSDRLNAPHELAQLIEAFIKSSQKVRPDEFRQFISNAGVWDRDPSLKLIMLATPGLDSTVYSGVNPGSRLVADLNELARLADGASYAAGDDEALLFRSFPLSKDLQARVESRSRGSGLRIIMLIDIKSIAEELSTLVPGMVNLGIRMQAGAEEGSETEPWSYQLSNPDSKVPLSKYSYKIPLAGVTWHLGWAEKSGAPTLNQEPSVREISAFAWAAIFLLTLIVLMPGRNQARGQAGLSAAHFMQLQNPVWRLDSNGFIVDLNHAAERFGKRSRQETIGFSRLQDLTQVPLITLRGPQFGVGTEDTLAMVPTAGDPNHAEAHESQRAPELKIQNTPEPAAPALDSFDMDHYKSLTGQDIHVLEEVRQITIKSLPVQYQALRNLVAKGDAHKIMLCAHTLKSSLALLGSTAAKDICMTIESNELQGLPLQTWVDRMQPHVNKMLKELIEADFGTPVPLASDNPFKKKRAS